MHAASQVAGSGKMVRHSFSGGPLTATNRPARGQRAPGDTSTGLALLMQALFHKAAPPALVPQIIAHPSMHLAIMVTSMKRPWTAAPDIILRLAFSSYLCAYAVWPRLPVTNLIFDRLCYYSGPSPPAFMASQPDVTCIPLTQGNFYEVLQATTAIPFLHRRVRHLPGAGEGLFYDGAVSDYMLNALLTDPDRPALLLSHGPVVQRVMVDVLLPWDRRLPRAYHANLSVLSPTPWFVSQLPGRVIPDTWDYFKPEFVKAPEKRHALWRGAYDLSLRLWPSSFLQLVQAWQLDHPKRKRGVESSDASRSRSTHGSGCWRCLTRCRAGGTSVGDERIEVAVFDDLPPAGEDRSLQQST
ncbi:MAG: hypothetical protein WDW38_005158 [Sanguina aurantia]